MNRFVLCAALAASVLWSLDSVSAAEPLYELRIYTCLPGRLDALHARFRDHTCDFFAKHGMTNVAYWTPTDEPKSATTLIYVLRHDSREKAEASWEAFRADPEWIKVRDASEQDGKILAQPPESIYMTATDYSAIAGPASPDKVYELRIYTAPEGKLAALHDRFRQSTDRLFKKHGMTSCAYWAPVDEPKSGNILVYVLEHASRDAADASWKAFRDDPEWQAVVRATEANGKIVSSVERTYMKATDYSPAAR